MIAPLYGDERESRAPVRLIVGGTNLDRLVVYFTALPLAMLLASEALREINDKIAIFTATGMLEQASTFAAGTWRSQLQNAEPDGSTMRRTWRRFPTQLVWCTKEIGVLRFRGGSQTEDPALAE